MVKRMLLSALFLCAVCSCKKQEYYPTPIEILSFMGGYIDVYLDTPQNVSDFVRYIEASMDDEVKTATLHEDTFFHFYRSKLAITRQDSTITIHKKNNPREVIFSGPFHVPVNSAERRLKAPAYFFDNDGLYFYCDSLVEAFRAIRLEVNKKHADYGNNWESVPDREDAGRMFPYRLVRLELRDGRLGLCFPADSVDIGASYYRELEAVASDFVSGNPEISRMVFESFVLKNKGTHRIALQDDRTRSNPD